MEPEGDGTAEEQPSIRQRALQASFLTLLNVGGQSGLRLVSNVVMARLLFPEAFGVMALVQIFVMGLQLFTDIGIGPSVIQSKRGEEDSFLDTAWTMQIGRGFFIWLGLSLLAYPASVFYGEPELAHLIPIVGLGAAITGFESTARFTLNKHLSLGRITAMELTAQAIAIGVMIAWASVWPTVWALVVGGIVSAVIRMIWSHRLDPNRRNHFRWHVGSAWEVVHFGKWIFITTAVGFLASQADRIILGKLASFEMLGIYSIAFTLHQIPDSLLGGLGNNVLFPAITHYLDRPRQELRAIMERNRLPLLAGLAALVAGIAVFGDILVNLLYDDRYRDAGWMLQLLAVGLWPRMVTNTTGPALLALGLPRYITYAASVRCTFVAVAVIAAHASAGMLGVVTVVALSSQIDYLIESYGLKQEGLWLWQQDIQLTLFWLGLLAAGAGLRLAIGLPITEAPIPW